MKTARRNSRKIVGSLGVLALLGLTSVAQADPLDVYDVDNANLGLSAYWGGQDGSSVINNNSYGDIVGDSRFEIYGATYDRSGGNLSVTIYSNYINTYATNGDTLGTTVGSLFLGPAPITYNSNAPDTAPAGNAGAPHYAEDVYYNQSNAAVGDFDRFSYVFDYDADPTRTSTNQTGSAALYEIDTSSHAAVGADVKTSDDFLNPAAGNFRLYQPVDRNTGATDTGIDGRWTLGVTGAANTLDVNGDGVVNAADQGIGYLKFDIVGLFNGTVQTTTGFALETTAIAFAWAMSCANDVIMATLLVPPEIVVPLPAGFVLLLTGLLGLGFLGRMRKKPGLVGV